MRGFPRGSSVMRSTKLQYLNWWLKKVITVKKRTLCANYAQRGSFGKPVNYAVWFLCQFCSHTLPEFLEFKVMFTASGTLFCYKISFTWNKNEKKKDIPTPAARSNCVEPGSWWSSPACSSHEMFRTACFFFTPPRTLWAGSEGSL